MSRDILQALSVTPNGTQPKNGFDLHSFETFSAKGGQLTVVGVRDTVPNSDYRMAVDAFTRSLPCNTANFAHIKENYYFVHVPLGLINRNAYQMLVQRKQPYSALDMGITRFPTFSLGTVLKRALEIAHLDLDVPANYKFADVHGYNIGRGLFRLFDLLGYGCYLDILESTFVDGGFSVAQAKLALSYLDNVHPTANRIAAYQMVWYYFFRNDIYDNDVTPRSFNFDDVTYVTSGDANYDILSVRQLDDFIIECCQLRYVPYKKDIFTGGMPGTQYGAVSTVTVGEITDLTAQFVGTRGSVTVATENTSPLAVTVNGTTGFSNGNFIDSTSGQSVNPDWPSGGVYDVHTSFVQGEDKITSAQKVVASPSFADVEHQRNLAGFPGSLGNGLLYDHNHSFYTSSGSAIGTMAGYFTPEGTVNLSGSSANSLFDVLQLVEAQAIQKWRQKSMLAGNKTADQFRAHHGEVPRHLIDHLPDFIGSVDNEIQITEITSQADTASSADESNLGEIAGRGYGASDNRYFHFHSDDYGVLLLLHAVVPENTYSSFGIDAGNTMVYYNDFYQSEFTNLGLQAVPKYLLNANEVNPQFDPSDAHGSEGTDTFTSDVGVADYAPRYYQYKQYPSRVHGMFNPTRLDVNTWVPESKFGFSDFQSFAMPRVDLVNPINGSSDFVVWNPLTLTKSNLYVHPAMFDSIFAMNADDSEVTDTFITHCKFICDASLPMPVLGLPQF